MKVRSMTSKNGNNTAPNQFIITEKGRGALGNFRTRETFQSYDSIIAVKTVWDDDVRIELDEVYWDYSRTTGTYRNMFLGETTAETRNKITDGSYKLKNLNK